MELKALGALRLGSSEHKIFHERNRIFQEKIPSSAIENCQAVIGFDTSSWIIAERARRAGKPFVLEQTAVHSVVNQAMLSRIARQFPEWGTTFERKPSAMLDCEQRELDLASKIVVASTFCKQSLVSQGVPPDNISFVPLGVDLQRFRPCSGKPDRQGIRFLFVGTVSAQKGAPLLLSAWQKLSLKGSELWLAGSASARVLALIPALPGLKLLGKVPYEGISDLLNQCDVLVLPSYSDGFARSLIEALACGLPIITTEATAGPDLIKDGVEGFLVRSGDAGALCEAMLRCVKDPVAVKQMSRAARRRAEQFSWDRFGEGWVKILNHAI